MQARKDGLPQLPQRLPVEAGDPIGIRSEELLRDVISALKAHEFGDAS